LVSVRGGTGAGAGREGEVEAIVATAAVAVTVAVGVLDVLCNRAAANQNTAKVRGTLLPLPTTAADSD
jgi:hypothetical protein